VRALAHNIANEVEFLHADEARPVQLLEEPTVVHGLRIAGLKDLVAMKLKVLAERGELRDYYDVKLIEEEAELPLEDGIALFLERYSLGPESEQLNHLIRALGYLDDVEEDEALPVSKADLAAWWQQRQGRLVRHLGRNPI
jgi:predicted nucleotidyltransferase component of viral defense system